MNRLKLYRLLRRNTSLSFRRSPAVEQSMIAKVLLFIGGGLFAIYLILYGTIMGMAVERGEYATIIGFMPFVMVIDFFIRFIVQQTPDMLVKPYILMPISKYSVIECFLATSLVSGYNLLWLCMFLPYSVIALASGCSFWGVLMALVCAELLIMLNSQIYLLIRTLIGRHLGWWGLAVAVYAALFLPWIVSWSEKGLDTMLDLYVEAAASPLFLVALLVVLAAMLYLNRQTQFRFVYEEISRQKKTELKSVSGFEFLSRFGETGEYLKLELKSVMRNKVMRSRFWMSLGLIVVFTLLIAYTPIYDGATMTNFWCFYCFAIYGVTSLTKVMGAEGNYIDMLMVHHENILSLLKAKFYFHCAILLVPFLLMLPAMVEGKFSLLMMVAYLLLCSGVLHFIMFQLAVYNKQTLPLEQKLTGKGNIENGMQLIIEMSALFVPIVFVTVLQLLFPTDTAYLIQAATGLLFTLASPWWLRNIYRRLMARKYENIEGFRASR